jgi:hypothetical protein
MCHSDGSGRVADMRLAASSPQREGIHDPAALVATANRPSTAAHRPSRRESAVARDREVSDRSEAVPTAEEVTSRG